MSSNKTNESDFNNHKDDDLGTGLSVLSVLIPLAVAIIYFSAKSNKPRKAKKACHCALWGFVGGFVINLIAFLVQN
jgi:hypothetical protein